VTDSATFPTPDTEEEDLGEDLGGLDDLLASLRSEETPAPKRGRGRAKKEAPAKDFKAVLWASADKLRAQMDAAEYKHLVLGLIFLKYISDTFAAQQGRVLLMVSDPDSDNYIGDDPADHQASLEERDYYTQENVFWVPADARWESLRARAKQPEIGQLIDKTPGRMGELVDLISTIGFADDPTLQGVVSSEEFVQSHGGRIDDISIYGQESDPTTWRLAAMNLAIRGFAADLGQEPADTFSRDQFPDLKFDYVKANPPFNISDWGGEKYENDPRWKYGRPPAGNANYAWLQHILWKQKPGGQAGVILANGSMSSNQSGEGQIREAMVRGDVVEAMVALPGQLFFNTQIPACIWFLTNDNNQRGRDRSGETLFIDARQMGTMETRVNRVLTEADIAKIAGTVHAWRSDGEVSDSCEDVEGFCYSAKLEEIEKNGFVLTPGRYVGAADVEDDGEVFEDKMKRLSTLLKQQQAQGAKLDAAIARNLAWLGFGAE
jgi:type I restriction enzyme M protein